MSEHKQRGQRGRSKATIDLIATCSEIIEAVQPITVRGVCYKLFVAGMIDSMSVNNTQKISRLLVDLREDGTVPWEWIVDDSRQMEREPHWTNVKEFAGAIKRSYRRDFWAHEDERVICISEKSTVAGILRPVLDEYGVPFLSAHGFNSATMLHELAETEASDARYYTFLYVVDHDPSGMRMSEMDLPGRLKRYGATASVEVERIALVESDVRGGRLPPFPAKKSDSRYEWYAENYGTNAWELDAMDPNTLRQRVTDAVLCHIDVDKWERHKLAEKAEQETVRTIAERMASAA